MASRITKNQKQSQQYESEENRFKNCRTKNKQ